MPPHNCMRAPRRTELPDKRRNKIRGFASRLGGGGVGDGGVGGEGGGGVGGGGVRFRRGGGVGGGGVSGR